MLSVTLLGREQLDLLEALGLRSGRDGNKLAELKYELDARGCPRFPGILPDDFCEVALGKLAGDITRRCSHIGQCIPDLQPLVRLPALCRIGKQELVTGFDHLDIVMQGILHGTSWLVTRK